VPSFTTYYLLSTTYHLLPITYYQLLPRYHHVTTGNFPATLPPLLLPFRKLPPRCQLPLRRRLISFRFALHNQPPFQHAAVVIWGDAAMQGGEGIDGCGFHESEA